MKLLPKVEVKMSAKMCAARKALKRPQRKPAKPLDLRCATCGKSRLANTDFSVFGFFRNRILCLCAGCEADWQHFMRDD
jgi:hypothetical protein